MSMRALVAVAVVFFGLILNVHAEDFKIVNISSNYLFAPVGFDDNDDVVVVVDGYMPDTCHRFLGSTATKDPVTGEISIRTQAKRFDGMCFDVIVPFTSVVSLGSMPTGNYTVTANAGALRAKVEVNKASAPGPDDYLYAAVDAARVQVNGPSHIVLEGRLTSTCLEFDRIDVFHHGNTLEVLPILKLAPLQSDTVCMPEEKAFIKTVQMPELKPGRYLLHVRSLNGQSINTVFNQN